MRLPGYKGNYPVGATTFTKPIRPTHLYSNARLDGKPVLKLEEIAYSVYYPTVKEKARSQSIPWVVRPLNAATAGWAKFAGQSYWLLWPFVYLLARFIRLPAYGDAPLRPASKPSDSGQSSTSSETLVGAHGKWPLVVFSHGLAGGRYTYSDYCGRLAAQGMVVLAIEHRDGSGPMVAPTDEQTGKPVPKLYLQVNELSWGNEPSTKLPLRKDQLTFRVQEIYESYASFKSVVDGNKDTTTSMESFDHWDSFKGQVDCSKVFLTGHSFGGATSLSLLSSPPPGGHTQLPIEKVVLLDPWLDPLPLPGTLPLAYADRPPLLIMNSEGFTLWSEHFRMMQKLVEDWRHQKHECATLVTIVRSKHHFYSDFALLMPFGQAKRIGMGVLDSAHKTTMAYFNGTLAEELKGKRGMETEPVPGKDKYGREKKQLVGQPGELIVH